MTSGKVAVVGCERVTSFLEYGMGTVRLFQDVYGSSINAIKPPTIPPTLAAAGLLRNFVVCVGDNVSVTLLGDVKGPGDRFAATEAVTLVVRNWVAFGDEELDNDVADGELIGGVEIGDSVFDNEGSNGVEIDDSVSDNEGIGGVEIDDSVSDNEGTGGFEIESGEGLLWDVAVLGEALASVVMGVGVRVFGCAMDGGTNENGPNAAPDGPIDINGAVLMPAIEATC
ncbi:hypothetical protein OBBRIDRAFT_533642 [Obba rivulosa]|uniref:Uncharacterized protein n=1 Tax=Obba rivulosa TaxID=1052685 RepID=A0A8E2B310_9APHY|nr:hypothetical protein OBBRIDRAFT_533642 [Obba rivulosa]